MVFSWLFIIFIINFRMYETSFIAMEFKFRNYQDNLCFVRSAFYAALQTHNRVRFQAVDDELKKAKPIFSECMCTRIRA